MPNVSCSNCGAKVPIPEGHSRAKIRCASCGYYADVPAELRSSTPSEEKGPDDRRKAPSPSPPASLPTKERGAKPTAKPTAKPVPSRKAKPNTNAADPRPNFEPDEPTGPNLLEGDEIERDDDETSPYAVPGTGLKKCPECRGDLPLDATLCVHCGTEIGSSQKKAKREYTPFFKEWEAYYSFDIRLKALFVLQGINLLLLILSFVIQKTDFGFPLFMAAIIQSGLQAFLVGSFDKLTIKRNAKGRTDISKLWRVVFFPTPIQKVDWKVSHGTALVPTHNPGPLEWGMMIYLLLCAGCLPGIVFYWFIIRPERYDVVLCDLHGSTDQMIFRTTNRELADEICRTINETTGLAYRPIV